MFARITSLLIALLYVGCLAPVQAAETQLPVESGYKIQAGDILDISVWNEKNLQQEVLVRPDGAISFPLVGSLTTKNKSIEELQREVTQKLHKYIPDPSVSVGLKQINGNKIYVLGKVNRPGEFLLSQDTDVMQALAKAGGLSTFASANDIRIIRRTNGAQNSIGFKYNDIEKGKALDQNIVLQPGDTVIVP